MVDTDLCYQWTLILLKSCEVADVIKDCEIRNMNLNTSFRQFFSASLLIRVL